MTKDEALKMALRWITDVSTNNEDEVINAIKEALEPTIAELNNEYLRDTHVEGMPKAETQEPVAWMWDDNGVSMYTADARHSEYVANHCPIHHLYTTSPSREWQSLSDDEIDLIIVHSDTLLAKDIAQAIEAKLKEKNEK